MTTLTQKFSQSVFGAALRVVTLSLFLVTLGAGAALAQTRAYVTNTLTDTVSVIDAATNTVVATVPVGGNPQGLAINPAGTFAYVANFDNTNVSVISTSTNTVVASVTVGFRPSSIAFPTRTQAPQGPTNKDQCKHGGWATFTNPSFPNQGQCVSYVNHLNH